MVKLFNRLSVGFHLEKAKTNPAQVEFDVFKGDQSLKMDGAGSRISLARTGIRPWGIGISGWGRVKYNPCFRTSAVIKLRVM